MATDEWNSIDDFEEEFPIFDCAFLDILGYKQRALDYFDNQFNLLERINRAFDTALLAQQVTSPLFDTSQFTLEVISDSIIMLQPSREKGLGVLIPFTCHFASALSFEGLFLRGGISRGQHCRRVTRHGFDFLASEALQKAYLLENEKAEVPRILVDSDLINVLYSEERDLLVSEGGHYFVDFAHHVINRQANNYADVLAEIIELSERLHKEPNERVKAKIRWLLDYYHWTIDTNPAWNGKEFPAYNSGVDRGFSRLKE